MKKTYRWLFGKSLGVWGKHTLWVSILICLGCLVSMGYYGPMVVFYYLFLGGVPIVALIIWCFYLIQSLWIKWLGGER